MPSYKKEAGKLRTEKELMRQANEHLERELKKLQDEKKKREDEKKKGFSCKVYCGNCQQVGQVSVPNGQSIKDSGCAWCGARGFGYLVVRVIS